MPMASEGMTPVFGKRNVVSLIDRLIRSKRKSITLVVEADGSLVVKAPLHMSLRAIEAVVLEKEKWIRRTQERIKLRPKTALPALRDGERFLFKGCEYSLEIIHDRPEIVEIGTTLRISEQGDRPMRTRLLLWYRKEAAALLAERVRYYSHQTGLAPRSLHLSNARKRWGSCSPHGRLNISWRLVMAPVEIVDYVVVHELVHLAIKNHSAGFKSAVAAIFPDAREREKWLQQNGFRLDF